MSDWVIASENSLRLGSYCLILITMLLLEQFVAARKPKQKAFWRWINNLALAWGNGLLIRFLFPLSLVAIANWAEENHFGILHLFNTPSWLALIISIISLDFIIYWQHRLFHSNQLLWKLHAVHHLDEDVDASTGGRFHPLEIVISFGLKIISVTALGVPAYAAILFEVLLACASTFSHSNIRLPLAAELGLRHFMVTPAVHRIHHSVKQNETDSNFGFFLIFWDKLFKTYITPKAQGEDTFPLGLKTRKQYNSVNLFSLLTLPWRYKNEN